MSGQTGDAARDRDAGDRMPGVELQTVREALGLTSEALARLLRVNARTVRAWEAGRDPIPYRVRSEVEALEAYTAECVEHVVQALLDSRDPEAAIVVYRSDEQLHAARPGFEDLTARWWRAVAYRAACEVPGTPIVTPPDSA
ncbi:MAG: DUF1870 family protein [Actinomycetaceae bacterium]|nr:DUF1870 family protein [Actinomycetaceae bacterium]